MRTRQKNINVNDKQRYQLFDIIRSIITPFGWVSLFYYPDRGTFIPANRYNEFIWHTKLEKFWTSQYFMLVEENEKESPMTNITQFPPSINIVAISSVMNQSTFCSQLQLALNSEECENLWKNNEYWYINKRQLYDHVSSFTNSTKLWMECEDCDLGFPVVKSEWTAMTLLQIFQNTSIYV